MNKKYDLDGDFKFNTARLINHSCEPNCEVYGTGLKVWVYAIKDIKRGMSYLMIMVLVLMKTINNFPVNGFKKCIGYIVREGSRWRIKKLKSKI